MGHRRYRGGASIGLVPWGTEPQRRTAGAVDPQPRRAASAAICARAVAIEGATPFTS
jgi:hypothetical protein